MPDETEAPTTPIRQRTPDELEAYKAGVRRAQALQLEEYQRALDAIRAGASPYEELQAYQDRLLAFTRAVLSA